MDFLHVVCYLTLFACVACLQDSGYFWHITDMHWDPTYDQDQQALSCNPDTPVGRDFGQFGDFHCDPPWELMNSSVNAMKQIRSQVDFLIWTGDDTPHIYNDTILHKQIVSEIITNLSDILQTVFPDKIVYSALGNHDWSPKHQLSPKPDPLYDVIAAKWAPWMDSSANETFTKAGYYTMSINPTLRVLVLNTNLYYTSNALTESMPDPGNQLQWIDDTLTQARVDNQKIMIVTHVPPGVFEKHRDKYWFYPYYNEVFLALMSKHAAVISSIHMGHHHTDSFRLLYNDMGEPVLAMLLAPSVTPWETTLPDVMGGRGNNPAIRLVQYDRPTGRVLDILQYYLDLNSANQNSAATWELEYQATEYFEIPDLSASSLDELAERMKTDDGAFGKYYKANGVLYDPDEVWTEDYRSVHICAIQNLGYEDYGLCMNPPTSGSVSPKPTTLFYISVIVAVLTLCI